MRALVVDNANDFDPGYVGQRFREHGYAFTDCHRERPADWPETRYERKATADGRRPFYLSFIPA